MKKLNNNEFKMIRNARKFQRKVSEIIAFKNRLENGLYIVPKKRSFINVL